MANRSAAGGRRARSPAKEVAVFCALADVAARIAAARGAGLCRLSLGGRQEVRRTAEQSEAAVAPRSAAASDRNLRDSGARVAAGAPRRQVRGADPAAAAADRDQAFRRPDGADRRDERQCRGRRPTDRARREQGHGGRGGDPDHHRLLRFLCGDRGRGAHAPVVARQHQLDDRWRDGRLFRDRRRHSGACAVASEKWRRRAAAVARAIRSDATYRT